jgi:hypothetical protein
MDKFKNKYSNTINQGGGKNTFGCLIPVSIDINGE